MVCNTIACHQTGGVMMYGYAFIPKVTQSSPLVYIWQWDSHQPYLLLQFQFIDIIVYSRAPIQKEWTFLSECKVIRD
jgi:hypothetical protein